MERMKKHRNKTAKPRKVEFEIVISMLDTRTGRTQRTKLSGLQLSAPIGRKAS